MVAHMHSHSYNLLIVFAEILKFAAIIIYTVSPPIPLGGILATRLIAAKIYIENLLESN